LDGVPTEGELVLGSVGGLPEPVALFDEAYCEFDPKAAMVGMFIMTAELASSKHCCGSVGSQGRFCTRLSLPGADSCGIAIHKMSKANVEKGVAYIRAPGKGEVAYLAPKMVVNTMPSGLLKILAEQRTVSAWSRLCLALEEQGDIAIGQDQVDVLEEKPSFGPTPRKRRVRLELGNKDDRESVEIMEDIELSELRIAEAEEFGSPVSTSSGALLVSEERVVPVDKWNSLVDFVTAAAQTSREVRADIGETTLKMSHLFASVGDRPDLRPLPGVNLWDCVAEIFARKTPQGAPQAGFSAEDKSKLKAELKAELKTELRVELKAELKAEVKTLQDEVDKLQLATADLDAKVCNVVTLVKDLLKHHNSNTGGSSGGSGNLPPDLLTRFVEAEKELSRIRSTMGGDAVKIGSEPYHHPHDLQAWVALNSPGADFLVSCYDFISMLEVVGDTNCTGEEKMEAQSMAAKAGHTTLRHARIVNSFSTVVPSVFQTKGKGGNPFSAIPSYEVWDAQDGRGGIKNKLEKEIERWATQMEGEIDTRYNDQARPKANALAKLFVTDSTNFWAKLIQWMGTFYTRLIQKAMNASPGTTLAEVREYDLNLKEAKEESWTFLLEILSDICNNMGDKRAVGASAEQMIASLDAHGLEVQTSMALYGTLKAHAFMKELVAKGFTRHPCLAPTFNTFLFSHRASFADIARIERKMGGKVSELAGLQSSLNQMETKVTKLMNKAKP
jgi:hypothetical protein